MNLNVSGHHLEVTPAIRTYVQSKLERIARHRVESKVGSEAFAELERIADPDDVAAAIHEQVAPASLMPSCRIWPFLSSL